MEQATLSEDLPPSLFHRTLRECSVCGTQQVPEARHCPQCQQANMDLILPEPLIPPAYDGTVIVQR